jgi:hypothetical protein
MTLQTILLLPERDPKPTPPRQLKPLVSKLNRPATELSVALREKPTAERVQWYFEKKHADLTRLLGVADEMHWTANGLENLD